MAKCRFASRGLWAAAIVVAMCVTQATIGASASGVRRVKTATGFKVYYAKPLVWQGDGVTVYLKGFEKMRKSAKEGIDRDYLLPLIAYDTKGRHFSCTSMTLLGPDGKLTPAGSYEVAGTSEHDGSVSGYFGWAFLWPKKPVNGFAELTAAMDDSEEVHADCGPYTVDELKQPQLLGDSKFAIRLVDWSVVHSDLQVDLFDSGYSEQRQYPHVVLRFLTVGAGGSGWTPDISAVLYGKRGEEIHSLGSRYSSMEWIRDGSRIYMGMRLDRKPGKHLGLRVTKIDPTGPAHRAGIRVGDLVTKIGGTSVSPVERFARIWADTQPGTTVPVEFIRDGKSRRVILAPAVDPDWAGVPVDMEQSWQMMQAMLHADQHAESGGLVIRFEDVSPDFALTKIKFALMTMAKPTKTVTFTFKNTPVPAGLWK